MPNEFDFYQVVLRSHLDSVWADSLPVVEFATTLGAGNVPVTVMTLRVRDQSEMMGLLNELHGRGLQVLSVDYVSGHGR